MWKGLPKGLLATFLRILTRETPQAGKNKGLDFFQCVNLAERTGLMGNENSNL